MISGDILTLDVENKEHTKCIFIKWLDNDTIEIKSINTGEILISHYKSVTHINSRPI
jgi:hypothetical protein